MKINILYNFNDGPWGGANQFLKILKNKLESENKYEEKPVEKLAEVSFRGTPSELRRVAAFLEDCAKRMELHPGFDHAHLQDFDEVVQTVEKGGSEPDVIVVK